MPDPAELDEKSQGWRDLATALPFIAALLLLPPVILLFAVPVAIGGAPLIVVYIFGVWAVLILAIWAASRRLAGADAPSDRPGTRGRV